MERLKNSLGIWMAGKTPTRFMADGYHAEVADEPMPEKYARMAEGLGDLLDGFEGHYPQEINEDIEKDVIQAIGDKDFYAVALGTFCMPDLKYGCFMNPDPGLRKHAMDITKGGIDQADRLGAKFIIWPGNDGYNYPNQADYTEMWKLFVDGIAEAVEYANSKGVTVFLEDKNSEPKMRILLANQAMCMLVIKKLAEMGIDTSNVKVNMDWQHLIMRGENLPQYAALLASENMLGHQHANSGWGQFDDDNIVGASYIEQTFGMAIELQLLGYGKNGERMGYDLFPYLEDQIEAAAMSIRMVNHMWERAALITEGPMREDYLKARRNLDTIRVLDIVNYVLLGLPRI